MGNDEQKEVMLIKQSQRSLQLSLRAEDEAISRGEQRQAGFSAGKTKSVVNEAHKRFTGKLKLRPRLKGEPLVKV
jgi:hypothetical protein